MTPDGRSWTFRRGIRPSRWALRLSRPWEIASRSVALGAAVLLVGALVQELGHDSDGGWTLVKLGAAAEIGVILCFVAGLRPSRKHQ